MFGILTFFVRFLWCDTLSVEAHCVSKIKLHGNCTGFEWSKEACYEGRCIDGVCQNASEKPKSVPANEPNEFSDSSTQRLRQKSQEFYKHKPQKPIRFQVMNVEELPKVSRFM